MLPSHLVKFCCLSTVAVIADGWAAGRTAMKTCLRNTSLVTGTANR